MRLAQAVNNERNAERNPVFLFDAGDQFTGTLWDTVHKGKVTAQVQNQLGLDAMVLGNHEVRCCVRGTCRPVPPGSQLGAELQKPPGS